MPTPTEQQFKQFQKLYNHFNKHLFDSKLPICLLLLSAKVKKVSGFFTSRHWENKTGDTTHEITMNPYFLSEAKDIEICKKLVEVMVTLWQHEYGTPSRKGYYNKEYADKLESLGLMPSNTGKKGGSRFGQKMDSYPIPKGKFSKVFQKISKDWLFPFRISEEKNKLPTKTRNKNKTTYRCSCGVTIWGKQNIRITCDDCGTSFKKKSK